MRKRTVKQPSWEVRPIGARALKSAGDTLRPYLLDATVLDLYAGQGRFGKRALEEGARHVDFVEIDSTRAKELRTYLAKDPARAQVWAVDAMVFLQKTPAKYDLLFADPPFPLWTAQTGNTLMQSLLGVSAVSAIFLVKHPSRVILSAPLPGLTLWKQARFGESTLTYYRRGD